MKTYARMIDGRVAQIIPPVVDSTGAEVPIEARFDPAIVAQLVEYDPLQRPEAPAPTVEQRIVAWRLLIASHLDTAAQAKGYDDVKSAALRAGFDGPYQAEGIAFAIWMDATWHLAYELLAQWGAGELAEPTPGELLAMLPQFTPPPGP